MHTLQIPSSVMGLTRVLNKRFCTSYRGALLQYRDIHISKGFHIICTAFQDVHIATSFTFQGVHGDKIPGVSTFQGAPH